MINVINRTDTVAMTIRFESLPGNLLPWLRLFVNFLRLVINIFFPSHSALYGTTYNRGSAYRKDSANKIKQWHTPKPRKGFEPTVPVFKRSKTVSALNRAATVTERSKHLLLLIIIIITIKIISGQYIFKDTELEYKIFWSIYRNC